jgi:hypothetical protein
MEHPMFAKPVVHAVFSCTVTLWQYPGPGSWHFVTLPTDIARAMQSQGTKRGWGSIKVRATIGDTTWDSSLFPDKASNSYLLPIKKQVRASEKLLVDTEIPLTITLI